MNALNPKDVSILETLLISRITPIIQELSKTNDRAKLLKLSEQLNQAISDSINHNARMRSGILSSEDVKVFARLSAM